MLSQLLLRSILATLLFDCILAPPAGAQAAGYEKAAFAGSVVLALAEDRQIDRFMRHHASASLDHLAADVDPFGRAQYIEPALAAAIILPWITRDRPLARSAIRVALAYFAADGTESILKPLVGRHRPDSTERPFSFRPFRNDAAWHSFPSAHATHAFALAEAISVESGSAPLRDAAFVGASIVGAQRVYKQAHWTSDVVVSAALSAVVTKAAEKYLRERIH
jgi:membrane-associated phospholipid phosphatase